MASLRSVEAPSLPLESPEMQLLLNCARRELSGKETANLSALARSAIDWGRLVDLAARHKMIPLLWWHLKANPTWVPAAEFAVLRRLFAQNARQMLQLSGELLDLNWLFTGHGIQLVPYKGPALGVHLYGNLALRQAGDLDLVVRRRDVTRARNLLLERGYKPQHDLAPGAEIFMIQSRYSESFAMAGGQTVELHWAFTNGDIALALDLESLTPNLVSMQMGGGSVSMFGDEDLLILLCAHGSKHRWDRLEWLCGVSELLRSKQDFFDWNHLLDRARRLGIRRMVLLGVLLAHDLLDAPVPDTVLQQARADTNVLQLRSEVPRLLVQTPGTDKDPTSLATDLFRIRLRERARDQIRFVWYRLTTPSRPESWSAVAIGNHTLPIHAFTRPFRLISKLVPALHGYFAGRQKP